MVHKIGYDFQLGGQSLLPGPQLWNFTETGYVFGAQVSLKQGKGLDPRAAHLRMKPGRMSKKFRNPIVGQILSHHIAKIYGRNTKMNRAQEIHKGKMQSIKWIKQISIINKYWHHIFGKYFSLEDQNWWKEHKNE